MKYLSIIIVLFLSQICCFGQKKDSINHQHLVLKFVPFVYLGTHSAIQFGLETNITQKTTIGFDFAYGSSDITSYYDGEVSRRYRLDLRWYEKQFASPKFRSNSFYGVEFYNRTNTYNTPIVIGRGLLPNNRFNYYERTSSEATYQVWGIYGKYGNVRTLNSHFSIEYYAGLGVAERLNKIASPSTLGEFDRVQDNGGNSSFNVWQFHSSSTFKRVGGDILLSAKLNYRIF
jgi:hypothetical protein